MLLCISSFHDSNIVEVKHKLGGLVHEVSVCTNFFGESRILSKVATLCIYTFCLTAVYHFGCRFFS
jgi:hypothetical protein